MARPENEEAGNILSYQFKSFAFTNSRNFDSDLEKVDDSFSY